MTRLQDGPEKTFAVVFDDGEEAVSSLLQFASDYQITAAYPSAIGGFHRVRWAVSMGQRRAYRAVVGPQDAPGGVLYPPPQRRSEFLSGLQRPASVRAGA